MKRFFRRYRAAYALEYRWLFNHCPPWRWLLDSAMWPGTRTWYAIQDVRIAAVENVGTWGAR